MGVLRFKWREKSIWRREQRRERERKREGFCREDDRGLKKVKIKNLTQLIKFLPTSLSTQHANLEHPNVFGFLYTLVARLKFKEIAEGLKRVCV
jgi:hypothetical protein